MHTLTRKPKQLTLALAVMAIGALVAVALIAGGAPAQATTAGTPSPDGNQSGGAPRPLATIEPCPGEAGSEYAAPAEVSSPGHYAIFDVYWDDDDKNLVTNPCPPEVKVEAHELDDGAGGTTTEYTYTRVASDIEIDSTIIQIPGPGVQVQANDQNAFQKWPFLYPDGTPSAIGDPLASKVWTLPACPHDPSVGLDPGVLCIGFTAESLKSGDWRDLDFEFESIREPGLDPDDRGRLFVFIPSDQVSADQDQIIWDTHDPDKNGIEVAAGDDRHQPWLFTKPGRYVLAVHVKGHPELPGTSIGYIANEKLKTVTSEVRTYTFHVGPLADLSVGVTAEPTVIGDTTLDPGDEVTITVTADNAGPNTATSTKVDVALPQGLTLSSSKSPKPTVGTYDSNTGIWSVGDLANGDSESLEITTTVADGTRGQPQTVTADIYATEHIGSSDVVELDPTHGNNNDDATVTPTAVPNVDPIFQITRTVKENAPTGTKVGPPVEVRDPDASEVLTFALEGTGENNFTATQVDGGAQIKVKAGASLDYDTTPSYDLILRVSDGKDGDGNADASIDDRIAVHIDLIDDPWDTVTLSPLSHQTAPVTDGTEVTFTARLAGAPSNHNATITYTWSSRYRQPLGTGWTAWAVNADHVNTHGATEDTFSLTVSGTGEAEVKVAVTVDDGHGGTHDYGSKEQTFTW